jgi:hypothetical protein
MMHWIHRGLPFCVLTTLLLAESAHASSDYLFVWAMEAQHYHDSMPMLENGEPHLAPWREESGLGKDFLAVFDVRPGPSFGRLVSTLPVGDAVMAHHTNYDEPSDHLLYANDWLGNRTYVFDLKDATQPRLARDFRSVGTYSYPHSFVHLKNGHTLATFQYAGGYNKGPGGLVEFDRDGRVVRQASAADPADPNIRPYSLAVAESLDRVVTGSADMMGAQRSHVAQVWRLSDLKLLKTMPLPAAPDWFDDTAEESSEPRVLDDGKSVVVSTFNCGLFLVKDLAGNMPTLAHVYDFGYRTCEVPVVVGRYWVQTMQSGHAVVSIDMHDPEHPREVSRLLMAPDEYPHWLGLEPAGDRLAITGYGALATHLRFARIDRDTGTLSLDSASIDFNRAWPDGWQGSAIPHGVVFRHP